METVKRKPGRPKKINNGNDIIKVDNKISNNTKLSDEDYQLLVDRDLIQVLKKVYESQFKPSTSLNDNKVVSSLLKKYTNTNPTSYTCSTCVYNAYLKLANFIFKTK